MASAAATRATTDYFSRHGHFTCLAWFKRTPPPEQSHLINVSLYEPLGLMAASNGQ
ncbi:hypothetical protein CCACVL1_27018 [Corchorus capsularis]|uniref:Uncharacterized protein n=1 Tax=Corchorus capsularis TaxID=210143 RepID=A0A1R3GCG6_COCAP|nr:hypothetical protein CCACVL1_27018 [Corchorus capsularis]